jgi:DNA-binding GntR family transcriptional regulator
MLSDETATTVAGAIARWEASDAPLYVALADALASALRSSTIPTHLPSERALARALHVSRGTVADAYDVLRSRGVVERQRGSGSVAVRRAHEICDDPLACVRAFFAG